MSSSEVNNSVVWIWRIPWCLVSILSISSGRQKTQSQRGKRRRPLGYSLGSQKLFIHLNQPYHVMPCVTPCHAFRHRDSFYVSVADFVLPLSLKKLFYSSFVLHSVGFQMLARRSEIERLHKISLTWILTSSKPELKRGRRRTHQQKGNGKVDHWHFVKVAGTKLFNRLGDSNILGARVVVSISWRSTSWHNLEWVNFAFDKLITIFICPLKTFVEWLDNQAASDESGHLTALEVMGIGIGIGHKMMCPRLFGSKKSAILSKDSCCL